MKQPHREKDEGMALILAVVFLIAMGAVVAFTTSRVVTNSSQVNAHVELINAFEGVESGIASAKEELESMVIAKASGVPYNATNDGLVGLPLGHDMTIMPNFGDPGVAPVALTRTASVQFIAFVYDWGADGIDNTGSGLDDEANHFALYSFSQSIRNGQVMASRRVENIIRGDNVNVWQNALFAGNGQVGNVINGNVSIHGSVHILGDDLAAGGVALEAIALSGTSMIHNNYTGLSADLRGRIPPLPTTVYNGETVETLNAVLRVKNGLVGMSGNSEIGESDVFGNTTKETMMGVYVDDGWTGNDIDSNGDPQSVYSDNGWSNGYDLAEAVPFPDFSDDGGTPFVIETYLEDFAYNGTPINPGIASNEVLIGDMTLQSGGQNYYWNASTMNSGDELQGVALGTGGMPNKSDLNTTDNFVWFDGDTNTLVINGRIAVSGDILFNAGNGAANRLFNYEGKGTFLSYDGTPAASGNIVVSADLKTTNFPGTNLIGLMAGGNMNLGQGSQLEMMGGFYAQANVEIDKQTIVTGTLVGRLFNMGGQVPSVYQVPALANSWTNQQRMIGSNPVLFLNPIAWRELGAR